MYVDAVCFPVRKNPGKRNEGNDIVKQIAMHSWLYCITYLGRYGQVSSRRVLCCTMRKHHAFLYRAFTFCRIWLGFLELHVLPRGAFVVVAVCCKMQEVAFMQHKHEHTSKE